jgi:hypothetical protein
MSEAELNAARIEQMQREQGASMQRDQHIQDALTAASTP